MPEQTLREWTKEQVKQLGSASLPEGRSTEAGTSYVTEGDIDGLDEATLLSVVEELRRQLTLSLDAKGTRALKRLRVILDKAQDPQEGVEALRTALSATLGEGKAHEVGASGVVTIEGIEYCALEAYAPHQGMTVADLREIVGKGSAELTHRGKYNKRPVSLYSKTLVDSKIRAIKNTTVFPAERLDSTGCVEHEGVNYCQVIPYAQHKSMSASLLHEWLARKGVEPAKGLFVDANTHKVPLYRVDEVDAAIQACQAETGDKRHPKK